MNTARTLLEKIEAFCREHDMAVSRFGIEVLHKPNFVQTLREGSDIRARTIDRCYEFMATHKKSTRRKQATR